MRSSVWAKIVIGVLLLSAGFTLASGYVGQAYAYTDHSGHHWGGGYWSGGCYYGGYYGGYPCYSYYYPYYSYPYYYSSSYCPSNSNYYGYPYYSSYYGYYSSYDCSPSSYTLTVSTDPSILGTVTGGGSYTSGSSASFSVTQSTVQVSSNTRYVFEHWSGGYSGAGTSGTVTVNGAMTVTAEYQQQYYLSVNAQPQNAPAAQGAGWYNAGTTETLQNGDQTIGDASSRLIFQGWSVDGQAPQTGPTLSVVMNAPHTAATVYGQQYYLNVQTEQGVTTGSGWYDCWGVQPKSTSQHPSAPNTASVSYSKAGRATSNPAANQPPSSWTARRPLLQHGELTPQCSTRP